MMLRAQLDLGHERINVEIDSSKPLRIHGGLLSIAEIAPAAPVQGKPPRAKDYLFRFAFAPDVMSNPANAATQYRGLSPRSKPPVSDRKSVVEGKGVSIRV